MSAGFTCVTSLVKSSNAPWTVRRTLSRSRNVCAIPTASGQTNATTDCLTTTARTSSPTTPSCSINRLDPRRGRRRLMAPIQPIAIRTRSSWRETGKPTVGWSIATLRSPPPSPTSATVVPTRTHGCCMHLPSTLTMLGLSRSRCCGMGSCDHLIMLLLLVSVWHSFQCQIW